MHLNIEISYRDGVKYFSKLFHGWDALYRKNYILEIDLQETRIYYSYKSFRISSVHNMLEVCISNFRTLD